MQQPQRDHILLCLKDLSALIIFVYRDTGIHLKAGEGRASCRRKQPRVWLRVAFSIHLKSLWVDWFVMRMLLLSHLHSGLWSLVRMHCWHSAAHSEGTRSWCGYQLVCSATNSLEVQPTCNFQWPWGTGTTCLRCATFLNCFKVLLDQEQTHPERWVRLAMDTGENQDANLLS